MCRILFCTCVADNIIMSATFTKLCITMYSESTRLSKDTRFIMSFHGTRKFITVTIADPRLRVSLSYMLGFLVKNCSFRARLQRCRMSATSQLPSTSAARIVHPQFEDMPCCGHLPVLQYWLKSQDIYLRPEQTIFVLNLMTQNFKPSKWI